MRTSYAWDRTDFLEFWVFWPQAWQIETGRLAGRGAGLPEQDGGASR
jgi:hypothetical protein